MRVWVFQTGEYLPYVDEGSRPMRAANLVHSLQQRGHRVTLWTADFVHHELRHRYGRNTHLRVDELVEMRFVTSPGYQRNIGVRRLRDHALLAANLKRALRYVDPPDVAFVGFPPVEAAAVFVQWLTDRNVPVVLDVKDQWPETLLRPVPRSLEPLGRLALAPYYSLARRAIRQADAVASISEPFLDWSLEFADRTRSRTDLVLPLTVPSDGADDLQTTSADEAWWDAKGVLAGPRPVLVYIGRLTTVVDFAPVLEAARACPEWQVVIGGAGPLGESLRTASIGLPNVELPGWLDHSKSVVLHSRATAVVIPYRQEAAFTLGVPNKALDALAHGLPILTSLDGHLRSLIEENGVGSHYGAQRSLADCLREWNTNPDLVESMSRAARHLYESRFSYDSVYSHLVDELERMAQSSDRAAGSRLSDRDIERDRYEAAAKSAMNRPASTGLPDDMGHLLEPYGYFHARIQQVIRPRDLVLELGAGTGQHSGVLAGTGAHVITLDISQTSLKVGADGKAASVWPVCGDMEALPVKSASIDAVVSAGSLSYADPHVLDSEIRRVLKPGGSLVVVDSLDHNPVYRINRWLQYRRGLRTYSTILRMPNQARIADLMRGFDRVEIRRFGSFAYLYPVLEKLVGRRRASEWCVSLDHLLGQGRHSFKFVLIAQGRAPQASGHHLSC